MSNTVEALEAQALKLSPEDRTDLVERLAASLATPLHPQWESEVARRLAEVDAGSVELLDGNQVFAALHARIGAHEPPK